MVAALLAVVAAALPPPASVPQTGPVAPETLVHLGVGLRLTHLAQLDALRAAQQDPRSPSFRRWLTPEQFGLQFGQPEALAARTVAWLAAGGLDVTPYPNRTFFEARGTAAQVKALLGVELEGVAGKPSAVHVPNRPPQFPAWLQGQVLFVSGLDTRVRFHHRLWDSFGDEALGPQDLRAQYDIAALHAAGFYGQGQQLVVLSYAEAPGNEVQAADVEWFYQNVSDADAVFQENVLANPEGDFDPEPGGRTEFELDVEMQSVGSPGAQSITLEEVPASQVFVLGPQDIANNMPTATAVSVSLGDCELAEMQQSESDNEITLMRNAIIQGTMEGQTWSAASGDNGSDDCGIGQPPATVDFPASIPEMMAMGGTEILDAGFNQYIALTAYNQEQVWNDAVLNGGYGGAGGGGVSQLFPEPSYQSGFGFSGRGVPDLALIAGLPTAIADVNEPGELDPLEGTSIASPLSAGIFGLIASTIGCRLGDVHAALYALGAAQQDGGAKVFNEITVGNNTTDGVTGYSAGPGYNLATGWGSMDVAALAKAFPACPVTDAGPVEVDAGVPYSQCAFINCASHCVTLPDGPSSCSYQSCNPNSDAGQCTRGDICSSAGPYAEDGDAGACTYGCNSDADCLDGGQCQLCYGVCAPLGNPTAQIGDPCSLPSDCATGGLCLAFLGVYDGGYCSAPCDPFGGNAACACPTGSTCYPLGQDYFACLGDCPADGGACSRAGYVCQPQETFGMNGPQLGTPACQPACQVIDGGIDAGVFDTCYEYSAYGTSCDIDSGLCVFPPSDGGVDAGTPDGGSADAGVEDAGRPDAGVRDAGPEGTPDSGPATAADSGTAADAGTPSTSSGCGCSPASGSPDLLLGALALVGLLRRRRIGHP